jgi:hypothetical protein
LLLIVVLTLFIFSCQNPISIDLSGDTDLQAEGEAYTFTDPVSNTVVFVDSNGKQTVIQSEEGGKQVFCEEVIDFVVFEAGKSISRSAGDGAPGMIAMILGRRDNGRPGLWVVYSNRSVKPVLYEDGLETSELLEIAENRRPIFWHFGWNYEALKLSPDGKIIIGYAEHKEGIDRHKFGIEPGTTVGVYWSVIEKKDGRIRLSRARVIGIRDRQWRKNLFSGVDKSLYRHTHRWMWALRLFFAGWYDQYLTMPEDFLLSETEGEYRISGTDQEGEAAIATLTAKRVLSIEKAPDEPPNQITGPDYPVLIAPNEDPTQPVVINLTVEGEVDPNDPIVFKYSVFDNPDNIPLTAPLFVFDEVNGTVTFTYDYAYAGAVVKLDFWTERGGLLSTPYRILFYFQPS